MPRSYHLKKRAESQDKTRQRIVDAAVALHCEVGPARTTVSAVAERAGVERHTYYRHFPDEKSLFLACSGRHFELHPMPDPASWSEMGDPRERLRRGLTELYEYYATNESMFANVIRDATFDALTAEVLKLRTAPHMTAIREALADGIVSEHRVGVALDLALAFPTWQTLTRTIGVDLDEAVELMMATVVCAVSLRS